MPQTVKILSYNLGYCAGFSGSIPQYILYGHRNFRCPQKIKNKVFDALEELVRKEQPDLCCFLEIDSHALTQMEYRLSTSYAHYHSENKYGETSVLRRMPRFSKNRNGFMSKQTSSFKSHYLKKGMKKLLLEIDITPDLSVFAGHFALRKDTRKKQFEEVKHLLQEKKQVILCGDFNIFKGFDELSDLIRQYDLRIVNTETDKTFPSHKPKRSLDLFICSRDIDVQSFRVLSEPKVSDHLPILMEIGI